MARPPTLSFERGTLLLHPPPPGKTWIDSVTWDDRRHVLEHSEAWPGSSTTRSPRLPTGFALLRQRVLQVA
jgi:hypothetical protein